MIDWLAAGFELSGDWIVGNKKRTGFLLRIIGSCFWIYVAVTKDVWGLIPAAGFMLIVNARNFWKWKRKR